MIIRYKDKNIDIDDLILQIDKKYRNQIIDEQFIQYAISISTPNDYDIEKLSEREIKEITERLIITDIIDILGNDILSENGILVFTDEHNDIQWKRI